MEENQNIIEVKSQSLLEKIPRWVLLAVTFVIPIFFIPLSSITTQFGTSLLFSFGVIISLLLYVVSGLIYGRLSLPKSSKYILGFTLLVPVVYTLAGVANGFSRMAFFGYTFDISTVGFILLGFAYMFVLSVLFSDRKSIIYSYLSIAITSIILAIFILLRAKFGADLLSFGVFKDLTLTPVGSFNNLGIFFGITALLSLLSYQMLEIKSFIKISLSILLLVSIFFLALVNFSVAWITLAISAFLFILYSIFGLSSWDFGTTFAHRLKRVPLLPLVVLIISIVFVVWGSSVGSFLSNKLKITNIEVRPNFSTTMNIAKSTIKSRPLFGSGPNTFVNQWLAYRSDEVVASSFWNTDFTNGIGLIPTFAVTTGLIGVLSWLIFLGFYAYIGFKSIFSRIEDKFSKYLIVSSFFVSLYLWAITFVYVPSTVVFILTLLFTGLFFASIYSVGLIDIETKAFSINPRSGFFSTLIFVSVIALSLFLGYGLWKNSASLWYFQKSSYAINTNGDIGTSEDLMLKAIQEVPSDIYFRALSQIELLKLNAVASQDTKKVKVEDIQKQFSDVLSNAIKAALAAKEVDPSNYLNWISVGQVYEAVSSPDLKIEGAYDSATLAYKEALTRNPKNPAILLLLSRLNVTKGDLKSARDYALQAIQQKRNYLDAYFLLSQIEVADNNLKGAIDSVTTATIIDPTNSAVFFQLGLLKYNNKDYAGAVESLNKAVGMTPDYANAKYFLGLSYEALGLHADAIKQFEEIKVTNPDSKEIDDILAKLKAGKSIFTDTTTEKPEAAKKLPVKEKVQ